MKDLKGASILITGGTGSFGRMFTKVVCEKWSPRRLVVFSRDELKQHQMRVDGYTHPAIRYFIGDVRDRRRLTRAMQGIDYVVHAAALKQVVACEYNPLEAIATNVDGAKNIIDAALDAGVKRVVALSTDKAVDPANLYGATKLCAEKLFVQANNYSSGGVSFSCVRYGNVVCSRGSVIPLFLKQRETGEITLTDPRMTRFWITLEAGVDFVTQSLALMRGGEVFVPKIPSMKVLDLAEALAPDCEVKTIGIRAGEKLHELLVSEVEGRTTREFEKMFVIQPAYNWWNEEPYSGGDPVPDGFRYGSETNTEWLTADALRSLVGESR